MSNRGFICCCYFLLLASTCSYGQDFRQKFITTDIDHFWEAYDVIRSTEDTIEQMKYLQQIYLNQASDGLRALMEVRRYTSQEYLTAIRNYPRFWESVRPNTEAVNVQFPKITSNVAALKKLYPDLRTAPIYFAVGVFRTNGTIKDGAVLIGSEMALSSKSVEISELPDHPRAFNELHNPIEDLPFLCVHEYVHTQQKELIDDLLSYVLYEGVAEFTAELAAGKESYVDAINYAQEHYEQVRDKFKEDLFIPSRIYNWLWSSNQTFGQRDLGYGVGYAIAKRYHANADDKRAAIKTMIELDFSAADQVQRFVDRSGYFNDSLSQIRDDFEKLRPTVTRISSMENGGRNIRPSVTQLTIHFSEPLNGYNTGLDFGPLGRAAFPEVIGDRLWSEDKASWTITLDLQPNKHYQLQISSNFRLDNGIPLIPYLVEFWTN